MSQGHTECVDEGTSLGLLVSPWDTSMCPWNMTMCPWDTTMYHCDTLPYPRDTLPYPKDILQYPRGTFHIPGTHIWNPSVPLSSTHLLCPRDTSKIYSVLTGECSSCWHEYIPIIAFSKSNLMESNFVKGYSIKNWGGGWEVFVLEKWSFCYLKHWTILIVKEAYPTFSKTKTPPPSTLFHIHDDNIHCGRFPS